MGLSGGSWHGLIIRPDLGNGIAIDWEAVRKLLYPSYESVCSASIPYAGLSASLSDFALFCCCSSSVVSSLAHFDVTVLEGGIGNAGFCSVRVRPSVPSSGVNRTAQFHPLKGCQQGKLLTLARSGRHCPVKQILLSDWEVV